MSEALTLTEYARLRVGNTLRTWLGNWPMSEFPRVFGAPSSTTGVSVDEYSILNYAPVYACTNVISGDVGSLPLTLNKVEKDGSKAPWADHSIYELVHDRPNPEMSSMVWRETLQAHALTWGNGYAEIERDGANRPVALWPITPDRVTVFREGRQLRYRVSNANGGNVVLSPTNIIHVPGMGFDGTVGYSIVSLARESFALGIATEKFGGTFFGNGSSFGGVISFKRERMDPEFKQGVRESIGAMHTGVDRAHKFLLLGNEAKYERLGIPPNDAQFLETRRFQIAEVARWFGGIPLHKLGDLERATFSNIEQQDIEYYKSCLRRWLVRWEQELNYKLISPLERRYQRIEFNVEGLLRGDSQARAEFYSKMFNIGAYSINMILEKENMNKIGPEGDVHYVPANLLAADVAMNGPLPKVTDVTPKALPPADDDEPDEEQKALRALLTEIAGNTAALQTSMAAEREAMSQAEREQHQQSMARLEEERTHLQQQLDEARTAHGTESTAIQAQADAAQQSADEDRVARQQAEADSLTARTAHEAATLAIAEARTARETAERRATEAVEAQAAAESLWTQDAQTARAEAEAARDGATEERTARERAEADLLAARMAQEAATIAITEAHHARETAERMATEAEQARTAVKAALTGDVTTARLEATASLALVEHVRAQAAEAQAAADAALVCVRAETDAQLTASIAASAALEARAMTDAEARAAAETAVAVEQHKRTEAETVAAAALAAQAEMDRQRTEVAAALAAHQQAEAERLTGMLTAHRALMVHVLGRVIRRETDRARRHQATPEKLRVWMDAFYVTHQDECLEELRPAIRTHLAWKQSAEDVDAVTLALVQEHICESQRQLRAIVDGEPDEMHANLERMLTRWEQDRPNALADRILKEEVDHVRSLR